MPKIIDYTILVLEGPQDAKNVRDYIRMGWAPLYTLVKGNGDDLYQAMVRYDSAEQEVFTNYEAITAWKQRAQNAEEKLQQNEMLNPCNFIFSTSMLVILVCFVSYILTVGCLI